MRKFALTLLVLLSLGFVAQAGPEPISGKEMKQVVPPPCPQWYADSEWNVGIWGTYVFTENGNVRLTDDTFDRYLGSDDAWGGGIDLKHFFHRYFGVGLEAYGLAVHREAPVTSIPIGVTCVVFNPQDEDKAVGAVLGTFTLRYPIGCSRFAPYVFAGGGAIFGGGDVQSFEFGGVSMGENYFEAYRGGDDTEMLGQFGGGLEVRITRHIGIVTDFSWNVVDGPQNNFGMVRAGVNFAF